MLRVHSAHLGFFGCCLKSLYLCDTFCYMATATISKKITKGEDLVVISRKEYEKLLRINSTVMLKRSPAFRVPKKHEKFYMRLSKELVDALDEYKKGDYKRVFESADEVMKSLTHR